MLKQKFIQERFHNKPQKKNKDSIRFSRSTSCEYFFKTLKDFSVHSGVKIPYTFCPPSEWVTTDFWNKLQEKFAVWEGINLISFLWILLPHKY